MFVDVELVIGGVNDGLSGRNRCGDNIVLRQASPYGKNDVGLLQEGVNRSWHHACAGTQRKRMLLGESALAFKRSGDRGLEQLGQLDQFVRRLSPKHALPGNDERRFGLYENFGRLGHVSGVSSANCSFYRRIIQCSLKLFYSRVIGYLN